MDADMPGDGKNSQGETKQDLPSISDTRKRDRPKVPLHATPDEFFTWPRLQSRRSCRQSFERSDNSSCVLKPIEWFALVL